MELELSDAEYVIRDLHPLLRVKVNGVEATMEPARKPALFDAGLVYVGPEFEGVLPSIEFRPPDGGPLTLEGFSDDRRLFLLFARFSRAAADDTFEPGPVPIPAAEDV